MRLWTCILLSYLIICVPDLTPRDEGGPPHVSLVIGSFPKPYILPIRTTGEYNLYFTLDLLYFLYT